jgi:hypothetical protein
VFLVDAGALLALAAGVTRLMITTSGPPALTPETAEDI